MEHYRSIRNECITKIWEAQRKYEMQLAESALKQPKRIFSYINHRTKMHHWIPNLIKVGNESEMIEEDQEKAEVMADYFGAVFTQEPPLEKEPNPITESTNQLLTVDFDQNDVLKTLSTLNMEKSTGPDELHPKILRHIAQYIAIPLTVIFKMSLDQGVLPMDWKDAIVTPIHKTGLRQVPSNYRPVSLTSVVIQILERIIKRTMTEFMKTNNLLNMAQHGFRKGLSCTTNLLIARELWINALDNGNSVDVVYIDFSKAFDKVPTNRLLLNLANLGIAGPFLKWIKDFLVGRRQKVRINSKCSIWRPVLSGVPQGSVLGPLLFIMYVNDLTSIVQSPMLLYADDVKIWRVITGDKDAFTLQADSNNMINWSKEWLMPINSEKCVYMHLGDSKVNTYNIGDVSLPVVRSHKDLGVTVSSDLKTTAHCREVAVKGFRTLWALKRTFTKLDTTMFTTLYISLVRTKLENCAQAASPCLKGDSDILEKVQRAATRAIPELRGLSYKQRLEKLNLFTLSYRRLRGDLILMYRIMRNDFGPNLFSLFLPTRSGHLRGHSRRVEKPRTNKISVAYRFSHRVINTWNLLPEAVVSASSIDSFKRRLDTHRSILEKE
ncbi:unnamed protein product [Schistosoma bovis]|nr:unnamed protein product [Schistosoma bovis]